MLDKSLRVFSFHVFAMPPATETLLGSGQPMASPHSFMELIGHHHTLPRALTQEPSFDLCTQYNKGNVGRGFDFLGYRFTADGLAVARQTVERCTP